MKSKCLPILLYGLECYSLLKANLHSLDFVVMRFLMNNVETSYFTQLKMCYLITTFWCPSAILITSWLFSAWWSTWPGNHLVPCVAELVGSCIPIHARRCLPDPKWLFYPSGHVVPLCRPLLPCPSRWHGSLPWHGVWWLTCELHCSPLPWKLGSMYQVWRSHWVTYFGCVE